MRKMAGKITETREYKQGDSKQHPHPHPHPPTHTHTHGLPFKWRGVTVGDVVGVVVVGEVVGVVVGEFVGVVVFTRNSSQTIARARGAVAMRAHTPKYKNRTSQEGKCETRGTLCRCKHTLYRCKHTLCRCKHYTENRAHGTAGKLGKLYTRKYGGCTVVGVVVAVDVGEVVGVVIFH